MRKHETIHAAVKRLSKTRDWHWCAYCWKGKRTERPDKDYCCHSSRNGGNKR